MGEKNLPCTSTANTNYEKSVHMIVSIVPYLGLVVALLVLVWGMIEMVSRFRRRQKKIDTQTMNTWIAFKPMPEELINEQLTNARADTEEESAEDLHKKAQQNGHYSESKKNL